MPHTPLSPNLPTPNLQPSNPQLSTLAACRLIMEEGPDRDSIPELPLPELRSLEEQLARKDKDKGSPCELPESVSLAIKCAVISARLTDTRRLSAQQAEAEVAPVLERVESLCRLVLADVRAKYPGEPLHQLNFDICIKPSIEAVEEVRGVCVPATGAVWHGAVWDVHLGV